MTLDWPCLQGLDWDAFYCVPHAVVSSLTFGRGETEKQGSGNGMRPQVDDTRLLPQRAAAKWFMELSGTSRFIYLILIWLYETTLENTGSLWIFNFG